MIDLVRATHAEALKLRRTLALWTVVIAPVVTVAMMTANLLSRARPVHLPRDPWTSFVTEGILFLWCILALPLHVTLQAALLSGLEHAEGTWKHLFALPIPRWTVYAAKLLAGALLLAASCVALGALSLVAGLVVGALRPEIGFPPGVPWGSVASEVGLIFLATWLMLAIQVWVSLRWSSFAVPSAVGIAATVAGLVLGISGGAPAWTHYYPWLLPFQSVVRGVQTAPLAVGVIGGLLVAAAGCWDVTRRDVV